MVFVELCKSIYYIMAGVESVNCYTGLGGGKIAQKGMDASPGRCIVPEKGMTSP